MVTVFFLTCDCRCSLYHLLSVSAGDQSGRVGDKIPEVFEILTFSSLVLFPLSSLPRTATWRGEAKRGCSLPVEPGCKLLQLFLPCRLSLSLSKGLLLCHLLICRANSCTSDSRSRRRRSAWRSEPRIFSIPAVCSSFSSGAGVAGMLEVPVIEKGRGLRL